MAKGAPRVGAVLEQHEDDPRELARSNNRQARAGVDVARAEAQGLGVHDAQRAQAQLGVSHHVIMTHAVTLFVVFPVMMWLCCLVLSHFVSLLM